MNDLLTYALAVFFLIVTPGPGVLSTAGVGSAFGARAGLRYVTGLFIGTNLVSFAVISGVAATLLAWPPLRVMLFLASTGYLLYLAFRIATAGSKIAIIPAIRQPGIRDGLALQAINPKAYAVNTALFSGFAFLPDSPLVEVTAKLLTATSGSERPGPTRHQHCDGSIHAAGRRSGLAEPALDLGGEYRNRTGVHGFAIRCVTTPPTRRRVRLH